MEVKIDGLEQVVANLKALDGEMQTKTLRKATKAGAKVVQDVAESLAPVRSGLLRDNIKIRTSSSAKNGVFKANVGVGKKDWTGEAFYASFVLWEHKAGKRSLGSSRKQVVGHDFLKQSAEQAGEKAANEIIDKIKEGIEQAGTKQS